MSKHYCCSNVDCSNIDEYDGEGYCPDCGKPLKDIGRFKRSNIKARKVIVRDSKNKEQGPNGESPDLNGINIPPSVRWPNHVLFSPKMTEEDIISKINNDMVSLKNHESGSAWMRAGTLLSMNPAQQMIGAGLKAIVDQNKMIIRQNELLYRELKKLNEHFNNESE